MSRNNAKAATISRKAGGMAERPELFPTSQRELTKQSLTKQSLTNQSLTNQSLDTNQSLNGA